MESAITAVHAKLGAQSPILDRDIKDALWNYYFDVDESVAYLKGASSPPPLGQANDALADSSVPSSRADEQRKKDKAAGTYISACVRLSVCVCAVSGTRENGVPTTFRPPPSDDAPTRSLAALSLDPTPAPVIPTPAPAKNKLAAKIAAAKAAKLAASSAPAPAATVELPAGARVAAPDGEKKLSKLQLKMLASQAARRSPLPPVAAVAPPRAPSPPPVDALPPAPHFAPASSAISLRASPSHFATTLAPSASASRDVLAKIELAMSRDSAVASAGIPAFGGPSPDDVVLLARKGTSLGAVPKRK